MPSLSEQLNRKLEQERVRHNGHGPIALMILGAIGVVFGDLGTSPLYAMRQAFVQTGMDVTALNVLRFLSMIFWLLTSIVSVKYIGFVMRANNKGEGGIVALLALVLRLTRPSPTLFRIMGILGVLAAGLFYADAAITPAISVLSALEGVEILAPEFNAVILPATMMILIGLFMVQKYGTAVMGRFFGPIVFVWFITLAILGLRAIVVAPEVLMAVNPWYAVEFVFHQPVLAFLAFGATLLAVTGAEAIYADMGHFGIKPIRYAWFMLVWPCLLLNYFGQGALLIQNPAAIENPFYLLAPPALLPALLVLATLATIIAAQAVISGAYSITRGAVQLGYLPRMRILHTSDKQMGQVYIPFLNWTLLVLVLALVLMFRSSSNLAAAYGVAVTADFIMTSIMLSVVMHLKWRWSISRVMCFLLPILMLEFALFGAAMTKIPNGGYVPLIVGACIFTLLTTWKSGQRLLNEAMATSSVSVDRFVQSIQVSQYNRVPGTAIYMTQWHNTIPAALLNNLRHNKVLHERVVFLTVIAQEIPHVLPENSIHVHQLGHDFYQLDIHIGYKDEPDVPEALRRCQLRGMDFDHIQQVSFFMGRETVVPTPGQGMAPWREHLFAWMKQNASSAVAYYKIPTDRVLEIGGRYEI